MKNLSVKINDNIFSKVNYFPPAAQFSYYTVQRSGASETQPPWHAGRRELPSGYFGPADGGETSSRRRPDVPGGAVRPRPRPRPAPPRRDTRLAPWGASSRLRVTRCTATKRPRATGVRRKTTAEA